MPLGVAPVPLHDERPDGVRLVDLRRAHVQFAGVRDLRERRDAVVLEPQHEAPAEIVERFAVGPRAARGARTHGPFVELAEDPVGRRAQREVDGLVGRTPRCVDREPFLVDEERDAAATLAALQAIRDVARAEPDAPRFVHGGDREQVRDQARAEPSRSTSSSIHVSTCRRSASAFIPFGSMTSPMLTVIVPGCFTKAWRGQTVPALCAIGTTFAPSWVARKAPPTWYWPRSPGGDARAFREHHDPEAHRDAVPALLDHLLERLASGVAVDRDRTRHREAPAEERDLEQFLLEHPDLRRQQHLEEQGLPRGLVFREDETGFVGRRSMPSTRYRTPQMCFANQTIVLAQCEIT
jgi:hypothetical protein